jgi:lipoprotein-releasing system permease protein
MVLLTVVGFLRMGMHDYDSKFGFMNLSALQKFLSQPGRVTHFNIKLKPHTNSRKVSDLLSQSFDYPFRAKDWGQLNKNLFFAVQLEKAVISILLTVILIVAAFNVISTLMMMIHDKLKEISILKAMGFSNQKCFQLFSILGIGIGFVGIGLGLMGGLCLSYLIQKTNVIHLPADVYYIDFLSVEFNWLEILTISTGTLIICFLSTLYPAWKVFHQSPLEGLRYD